MYSSSYITILFMLILCSLEVSAQREIILPAHKVIQLSTLEETVAAEVQPGDLVMLRVTLDVRIDNELIIRHGAFAQAQVRLRYIDARRKKPELLLVPTTVQAVNGTMLPIYGDGLAFGGRGASVRPVLSNSSHLAAAIQYTTKLFFN